MLKASARNSKSHRLSDGKVLEQAHIEIRSMRQGENVAAGIAIGKPLGRGEGVAVEQARSLDSCRMLDRDRAMDRSDDIGVRLTEPGSTPD